MNDFIFPDRIEEQLVELLTYPEVMPNLIGFYGEAGSGKTSFAKYLAKKIGANLQYFAMNEGGIDSRWIDANRCWFLGRSVLDDLSKSIQKITIIDEFHNLKKDKQDQFKTLFDDVPDTHLIIVCFNSEVGKSMDQTLSSPIYSRLHLIDFNLWTKELDAMILKVKAKYSDLSEIEIRAMLPDMRRITRVAGIAQRRSERQVA